MKSALNSGPETWTPQASTTAWQVADFHYVSDFASFCMAEILSLSSWICQSYVSVNHHLQSLKAGYIPFYEFFALQLCKPVILIMITLKIMLVVDAVI